MGVSRTREQQQAYLLLNAQSQSCTAMRLGVVNCAAYYESDSSLSSEQVMALTMFPSKLVLQINDVESSFSHVSNATLIRMSTALISRSFATAINILLYLWG